MNHNMNYGPSAGPHPQDQGGQGFYGDQFQYQPMSPYGANSMFPGGGGGPEPSASAHVYGNQSSPYSPSPGGQDGQGMPSQSGFPGTPYYGGSTGYNYNPQRQMHHGSSSFPPPDAFAPGPNGGCSGGPPMRPPVLSPMMANRPHGGLSGPGDLSNKFQPDGFPGRGFPGGFNNGFSEGGHPSGGGFSPGGPGPKGGSESSPQAMGGSPRLVGLGEDLPECDNGPRTSMKGDNHSQASGEPVLLPTPQTPKSVKSEPGDCVKHENNNPEEHSDFKPGDSISSSSGSVLCGLSERPGTACSNLEQDPPHPNESSQTQCASNSSPFEGGKASLTHPNSTQNKNNNDHHQHHHHHPSLLDNLDAISALPDIPELKFGEGEGSNSGPNHGVSMASYMESDHRGGNLSNAGPGMPGNNHPMFDNYGMGHQQHHMSESPMQFPMHMSYPGQQMYNYNYQAMYPQQGGQGISGNRSGNDGGLGYSQGMGMEMPHPGWWSNGPGGVVGGAPGMPRTPSPSEMSPEAAFRMPGGGPQVPGPWAMRGMRPRPDGRRGGITRPRLPTPDSGSPGSNPSDIGAGSLGSPYMGGPSFPSGSDLGTAALDLGPSSPTSRSKKRGPGRPRGGLSPSAAAVLMDPSNPGAVNDGPPKPKASKSTNVNKKRYTCEVCQKRFSTAWYVRVHRKSHNGERPYICHNCGKGFMLPNVLQVHLRKCEKNNPPPAPVLPVILPDLPPGVPGGAGRMPPNDMADSLHQQSPPQSSPSLMAPSPMMSQQFGQAQQQIPQGPLGPFGSMMGGGVPPPPPPSSYNQRFMGYPPHMGDMGPHFNPDQPLPGSFDMTPPQSHQGSVGGGSSSPSHGQYPPGMYSPGMGSRPQPPMTSGGETIPPNSSPSSGHFLANDRPPDKGGGAVRSNSEEKPYPPGVNPDIYCNLCEIQFDDKTALEEHLKSHRPYSCEVCEKRFSQKCNLITHIRLHTGEKPYLCSFCDKRFTQKGNLDAHIKTHTKEKPYPCLQCGKKFAFKSSMLAHVKQTHGGSLGMEWDEDDISSIKQQLKFNSSTPDYIPATSLTPPVTSPHNYSSGIPTPQSSLDSIPGSVPPPGMMNPYHPYMSSSSSMDAPSTPHSTTPIGNGGDSLDPVGYQHLPLQPVLSSNEPPPDMTNHISKLASLAASSGGPLPQGPVNPPTGSKPQDVGVN